MNLDKRIGLNDKRYLQMQYSQLNAFDRNIIVTIVEIYLSKRIEGTGSHILGLTDNCEIATQLCATWSSPVMPRLFSWCIKRNFFVFFSHRVSLLNNNFLILGIFISFIIIVN